LRLRVLKRFRVGFCVPLWILRQLSVLYVCTVHCAVADLEWQKMQRLFEGIVRVLEKEEQRHSDCLMPRINKGGRGALENVVWGSSLVNSRVCMLTLIPSFAFLDNEVTLPQNIFVLVEVLDVHCF